MQQIIEAGFIAKQTLEVSMRQIRTGWIITGLIAAFMLLVYFGVLIWVGLRLREPKLGTLFPLVR